MNLKLERSGPWIGVTGMFVMLWLAFTSVFLYAPWWGFLLHLIVLASFVPLLRSWAKTAAGSMHLDPGRTHSSPGVAINALGVLVFGWSVR